MADPLRDLIDLVLRSLDRRDADGGALAREAGFSRDHLDRILRAATGESPVALRRRLLLERAAWQLGAGAATPTQAASAAGYGSLAAFSRAFKRAHGVAPAAFGAGRPFALDAPNGIHFHPPGGLLVPGPARQAEASGGGADLSERMVRLHLSRTRELLAAAARLPAEQLTRPLRPGFVAVFFEGEEADAATMAERLVWALEVWVAAIVGRELPAPQGTLLERLDRAARDFTRIARMIRDRDAWDDAFVDALCEPPQSFTYGGVLSHVLAAGVVRREMLAGVLAELGAGVGNADPVLWASGASR